MLLARIACVFRAEIPLDEVSCHIDELLFFVGRNHLFAHPGIDRLTLEPFLFGTAVTAAHRLNSTGHQMAPFDVSITADAYTAYFPGSVQ
ncbi:hypothetical protein D3C86_1993300 [compost metagenome]